MKREPDHNALIAQGIAMRFQDRIHLDGVYALQGYIEEALNKERLATLEECAAMIEAREFTDYIPKWGADTDISDVYDAIAVAIRALAEEGQGE